ncbi:hypothetical protein FKP32DRAFT_1590464 [Trametes sanguinea]|nr:hypothetical protein FKP32DRAFT_1590464 [Trametes sanguinea]
MSRQLRIAIAFAALRHKPTTQSIEAYIFDLQTAFPLICTCHPSRPALQPNPGLTPDPWRDRVVTLEKQIEELRAQHDKERLELLTLRKASRNAASRSTPDQEAAHATTGKKGKGKKTKPSAPAKTSTAAPTLVATPVRQTAEIDLPAILQGQCPGTSYVVDHPQIHLFCFTLRVSALLLFSFWVRT